MDKVQDDPSKILGLSGPGPAQYFLPSTIGHNNHDISKSRSPSFSMGVRLPGIFCEQNVKSPSPGPKYQVEYMTKYGRANIPSTSFPNLKRARPQSCKLVAESRNRSLDRVLRGRSPARYSGRDFSRRPSDMQNNTRENSKTPAKAEVHENRRNVKVGESKALNLNINNELRAFCSQYQGKPPIRRERISSANRFSSVSPRLRNDGRQERY